MGVLNMAKTIKEVHPDYLMIYKAGAFCNTYGKDSYIISSNFNYQIKTKDGIAMCGFSKRAINMVISTLEDKKINYMIIDPRNNYDVDEKSDNRNLNTYYKEFEKSRQIVKQRNKISIICEKLENLIGKENFKTIIKKMEDILDED